MYQHYLERFILYWGVLCLVLYHEPSRPYTGILLIGVYLIGRFIKARYLKKLLNNSTLTKKEYYLLKKLLQSKYLAPKPYGAAVKESQIRDFPLKELKNSIPGMIIKKNQGFLYFFIKREKLMKKNYQRYAKSFGLSSYKYGSTIFIRRYPYKLIGFDLERFSPILLDFERNKIFVLLEDAP